MHDGALVDAAADEVHTHSDEGDDAEHTPRGQCLCVCMDDAAGVARAAFEEIGAVVDGGDKGYAALAEGVGFAEEGDDGGLAARGGVGGGFLLVV